MKTKTKVSALEKECREKRLSKYFLQQRHSKFLNRFWTKKEVDYARFSDNKPKAVV
jgi:hypothetical protein